MKTDFSYRVEGMFALILPESPAGEMAMAQVMEMTDGTAKVLACQLATFKTSLHRAGYSISKRRQESRLGGDDLLQELRAELGSQAV